MAKAKRGVLYVMWGEKAEAMLQRAMASVKAVHPELPIEVARIPIELEENDHPNKMFLQKARMFDLSPFEETAYLDADTMVLGRLDYAFEKAAQFGVACSICENPWARRHLSIKGDVIEYNTGAIFFAQQAKPLFDEWKKLAGELDSTHRGAYKGQPYEMPYNDQCSFSAAVHALNISPFVLPLNWNFRPKWYRSFFGPIKIWHDHSTPHDVFKQMSAYYEKDDAIIQYHPIS